MYSSQSNEIETKRLNVKMDYINPQDTNYDEKYIKKINFLENVIVSSETGRDKFKVINFEAGFGKSMETNNILHKEVNGWHDLDEGESPKKYLLVKRFKDDVTKSVEMIGKNDFLRNRVVGIHSDNWSNGETWRNRLNELKSKQVLIITHARYISLCTDETMRNYFMEGRHTLIIDEKIEFPIYSFNMSDFQILHSIFHFSSFDLILRVCNPLFTKMEDLKKQKDNKGQLLFNNHILPCSPKLENMSLLTELREHLQNLDNRQLHDKAEGILNSIEVIYNNKCLFNGNKISSCNSRHKLVGLENNIILDANGEVDKLYSDEVSDTFTVSRQTKIINHSDSTIQHIQFNASKSRISKIDEEYFTQIIQMIKENHKQGDRTFIVLQKAFIMHGDKEGLFLQHLRRQGINDVFVGAEDEHNIYNNEEFAVNWFGNIIGRNTWREFNKCWIIGSPNLPMDTHVLNLYQYSGKANWKIGLKMIRKEKDKYEFQNKKLEAIKKGYIIGEIYQAIKRIQRNTRPKGEFFIVNGDEKVFNEVKKQLKNIKVIESVQLNIQTKKEKARREAQSTNKKELTENAIKAVLEKKAGKYKKSDIEMEAGIPKSHLSKYLNEKITEVAKHLGKDFRIERTVIIRY